MARLLQCFVAAVLLFQDVSVNADILDRFLKFIENFDKPYTNGTDEFHHRLHIFKVFLVLEVNHYTLIHLNLLKLL